MTVDALTRRALLVTGGATAVAVVTAAGAHAATPVFLHGVASGDPLPDGVLLWTRVTPTPSATPGSGAGPSVAVTWQIATDPGFADVVAGGTVTTGPERDHTVKVDARGCSASCSASPRTATRSTRTSGTGTTPTATSS